MKGSPACAIIFRIMPADLHIHSSLSDGSDTPEEVVEKAKDAGLITISITDHDLIDGIDRATEEGKKRGLSVIPGVEFTSEVPNAEVHILGYFIDHKSEHLRGVLNKIREERRARIHKIAEKLKKIGIDLDPLKVLELAKDGSVGRPHVARVLKDMGVVKTIRGAFDKYIGWNGPAYVPHYKLSPEEAIKLVLGVGGIPVYAHPAVSNCDDMIPELLSYGLRGIEAYYAGHSEETTKHYLALAVRCDLLVTGGSDYHGVVGPREMKLGDFSIPDEIVDKLYQARDKEQCLRKI